MSGDRTSDDGSDIFWPGYVDAVTNLVLNLLFLLTIMTVAVFMFAMELGKQHTSVNAPRGESVVEEVPPVSAQDARTEVAPMPEKEGESADVLKRQVAELQQEIKQLMAEKQQKERIVTATKPFATPEKGVERVRAEGGGLVVQFTNDAVALTPDEASKLRTELKVLSGSGKIHVDVTVPQGFSEAKRLGFYRAMAVRNLLIEMKVPANRIEVSVREGRARSDASLVHVSSR